jgi:hypothetical protein
MACLQFHHSTQTTRTRNQGRTTLPFVHQNLIEHLGAETLNAVSVIKARMESEIFTNYHRFPDKPDLSSV